MTARVCRLIKAISYNFWELPLALFQGSQAAITFNPNDSAYKERLRLLWFQFPGHRLTIVIEMSREFDGRKKIVVNHVRNIEIGQ
jgi:hypothetical protein